jgi:hypothetical protein
VSPRVAVAVLSLAAVPVGGGPARADNAAAVLRLVWFDPADVASGSETVARAEATALLARMGATVSWRRATSPEPIQSGDIWVTLIGEGPQTASGPLVLGATGKGHTVASVVWVRVPNVRAALGISRTMSILALPPFERRLLAVALGRVIAHEVVHARVPSLPHGTGLMSRSLTRRQLTAGSIAFEPEVAFALQAALRGDPVFAPPGTRGMTTDAQLPEMDRWDR